MVSGALTKLMTVYVALDGVRNGKLTLNTPLVMSVRATSFEAITTLAERAEGAGSGLG